MKIVKPYYTFKCFIHTGVWREMNNTLNQCVHGVKMRHSNIRYLINVCVEVISIHVYKRMNATNIVHVLLFRPENTASTTTTCAALNNVRIDVMAYCIQGNSFDSLNVRCNLPEPYSKYIETQRFRKILYTGFLRLITVAYTTHTYDTHVWSLQ